MDYGRVFCFGFDWLKTKDSIKLFLQVGAVYAVYYLLQVLLDYFLKKFSTTDPMVLFGYLLFVLLSIVLTVVFYFYYCSVGVFALKRIGRKPIFFGPEEFLEAIKLSVAMYLRSFFWCHNTKVRAAQLACIIAGIAGLIIAVLFFSSGNYLLGGLLLFILFVIFFVYFFVVVYCLMRYRLATMFFLDSKESSSDNLGKCWNFTRGSIFEIWIALAGSGFLFAVILLIVMFILMVIFSFLVIFIVPSESWLFDFFYIILSLGFSLLVFFPQTFFEAATFDELLKKRAIQ